MKNQPEPASDEDKRKSSYTSKNVNAESITEFKASTTDSKKNNNDPGINEFNLTLKELAILASMAKGNSCKMIAYDCNIAINTVREHIRNILSKIERTFLYGGSVVGIEEKHQLGQLFRNKYQG